MSHTGGVGSTCAIYGCRNYKQQKESKSFFRMPKNKDILKKWIIACNRKDLDDLLEIKEVDYFYKTYVVCSDHFEIHWFRNRNLLSQGLLPGSVPTIFCYNVPNEQNRENQDAIVFQHSPNKRQKVADIGELSTCETSSNECNEASTRDLIKTLKQENAKLKSCIQHYKKKLNNRACLLWKYKKANRRLLQKLSQFEQAKTANVNVGMNKVCEQFINTQFRLINKHKMGRRYESGDKELALALYYCSTKSYVLLQKFFCLPSLSSLRSWLNNLHVACGINTVVMQLLTIKCEKLRPEEKVISLVFDEMSLQESLSYDARRDVFEGFEDFADGRPNTLKLCNQAMVVMIKGLYLDFKQVIGYFLSKEAMTADNFKDLFLEIIKKVQETGFLIKTIVCDLGSNNVKLRRLLSVSITEPYIIVNGQKMYFFYDTPHLLKCVRNNFKKYDIQCEEKRYSWSHVVNFYSIDSQQIPRMAPKLTKKCIVLPPFSPMRVCLAANLLSYSVHVGILCNVALNNLSANAAHTADFIANIDTLFDIFNSAKYNDKMYRMPLSVKSNYHVEKLKELSTFLSTIKILNKRGINPTCINGWIANINALILLWDDLKSNHSFKFLFTRRLTQDCVENLFSIIRAKGGNNITPDSVKFRCNLRSVMANQLLQPSADSNCEVDACSFLLQKQDIFKKIVIPITSSTANYDTADNNISASTSLAEKNSECYVLGWVCSQLLHKKCKEQLCNLENNYDILNTQIELKKYTHNSKLYFPNDMAKKASDIINETFKNNIDLIIKENVYNVKARLIALSSIKENMGNVCNDCCNLFLSKYFNVLLKAYVNKRNDCNKAQLVNKMTFKSTKLKKISHNYIRIFI